MSQPPTDASSVRGESNPSGVVGEAGRYPARTAPVVPWSVAGRRILPVGALRVYTCGITPYDVTHVGHASTFVWADLITSVAKALGPGAVLCRNVTDVDDVLTAAAALRGRPYDEFALTQQFRFERDMRALAVADPTLTPHARGHVRSVQRLALALLESGAAYESEDHVYFRGAEVPAAAGLSQEAALSASDAFGDQSDVPGRESPFDVAVWRPSSPEHPAWPSPWGWGRPGWHAECAAMALVELGPAIDLLVGGSDLAFPHHAYQQAMVEAASGAHPFARAVMHVGEVRVNGAKMAKSTQNLVLVEDLLDRYPAPAVRLGLLDRVWSEPWDCEDAVFDRAAATLEGLYAAAGRARGPGDATEVLRVLATDLDVPGVLALAQEEGGATARLAVDLLKLTEVPPTG